MERTLNPPPIPLAPGRENLLPDLLRAIWHLVCYPFMRPFTDHPPGSNRILLSGFRFLLMVIEVRLALAAIQTLIRLIPSTLAATVQANFHTTPNSVPHLPTTPTYHPPDPIEICGWLGVFVLAVLLDRQNPTWPIHLVGHRPFVELGRRIPEVPLPTVDPHAMVLGRPYARTWIETENRFDEQPLADEVYSVTVPQLCTHATVVAPTRAGKTHNMTIPLIELVDRVEGAGIFIDAKGDDLTGPDFDSTYPGAFHLRFDLQDWEHSFRLQLWVGRTIEERAERLAECLIRDGTSEESRYFSHNARAAFINLTLAHHAVYGQEPSFPALIGYLRNPKSREELAGRLGRKSTPTKQDSATNTNTGTNAGNAGSAPTQPSDPRYQKIADALSRIEELRNGKGDVLGNLDAVLDPLARPNVARFFAEPGSGHTIEDLIQARVRVCFTLPTGPMPSIAPLIGRIIISQYTQVVLDARNNTKYLKLIVVEDATNFVTPVLGTAMAQASSHQAAYVLIFQNLSQLRDEALIQDILTNSGFKITLNGIGDADSKRFSTLFGIRQRLFLTASASSSHGLGETRSSGHSQNSGSSHRGGSDTRQHTTGLSLVPQSRPDFTATELRMLPDHHAVIERRDNRGHLTPATMVHFDTALRLTLTRHQRHTLFGSEVEPINHILPLLDLDLTSLDTSEGEAGLLADPIVIPTLPDPAAQQRTPATVQLSDLDTDSPSVSTQAGLALPAPTSANSEIAAPASIPTTAENPVDSERRTAPLPALESPPDSAANADTAPAADSLPAGSIDTQPTGAPAAPPTPTEWNAPSQARNAVQQLVSGNPAGRGTESSLANVELRPRPSRRSTGGGSVGRRRKAGNSDPKAASVQERLPLADKPNADPPAPAPATLNGALDRDTANSLLLALNLDLGSAAYFADLALLNEYDAPRFQAMLAEAAALPATRLQAFLYQRLPPPAIGIEMGDINELDEMEE